MKNRIRHFLVGGVIAVSIACIGVFLILTAFLNEQNENTITDLGNIYMSSMNNRISKHFESITDHRLSQMKALIEDIPPAYGGSKDELKEWLAYNGRARGYNSLAYCFNDARMEMIYGKQMVIANPESFLKVMERGEGRIAVGNNGDGKRVSLVCVPAHINVSGLEECVAIVGELPLSYIADTLSLEEEDSLIYSFVIRKNGDFVVQYSGAVRDNYFDRVEALYEEYDGRTPGQYTAELEDAMKNGTDYSTMIMIEGERRHLYASPLPNSVWYLVTLMPYGALNESVENLGNRALGASALACVAILLLLLAMFTVYFRLNRALTKEMEQAKREAEAASRSKSEFLSNMSHDIRTPMNAIVGMTAIATSRIDDKQQVQSCLKKIALSSKHLLGLINDVLDMSKIESGKMTLNTELVSLREVMDGIVGIVQPQIKAKNQKFNITIYNITSENVHCDSVRFNQIMLNLLSNAMKFTPEGGSIDLILHEERSPKGDSYARLRIHVKDTGIGMSDEFRSHIFESFSREDNKRVHRTEGTGLGMAITKYIVDAMGGEISVSSKQGVGTEFQVVLDLERAEEIEEDMVLPDWIMLVVDDDRQLCESTVDSLRSIGIRSEWVQDGESAVKMAAQHHKNHNDYHVILLDWKLPDTDGIQVARELRSQLGDDVPILLMSAYDWTEIEDEARAAGISGFLMKPLFRSTLYFGLKPYTDEMKVKANEEEVAKPQFMGKRILVAEDNELNWEIARELLSEQGLELEWAENGQVCVDMFGRSETGYYDMILMDIRMPIMNGYEATDAIRAMNRSDVSMPIVAMTADAYSDDIQRCLEHGMNAHIAKPIDIKEVTRILSKYFG